MAGPDRRSRSLATAKPDQGTNRGLESLGGEGPAAGLARGAKLTEQRLVEARREIDRMLKANESDAEAIRNRLADCGAALLPEVTARLKETADDGQRQRLWALRYRLAAADSLTLRWPGGLQRLADSDARHRQQAADELARLATVADQPLLIELFSDNDPLVRELSLRGLQNIGGKETTAALVKLLADPEPNVRAAVLKQLAEKPDASIIPKLAEYLKAEKDPDLVVHAIRFLQAAGGAPATRALIPMLRHESWQVRAEACDALGKTEQRHSYSYVNGVPVENVDNLQVEVYVAMLDLLADADAFVVSRAVDGLSQADMAVAVDPLVRAAARHPDLAPKIVEILAQGRTMKVAALPHLRKFRKHENPQVRAAALAGLCTIVPDEIGDETSAGLQDPSDKVRIAAAQVCFKAMEEQRSKQFQGKQGLQNSTFEVSGDVVVVQQSSSVSSFLGNIADFFSKSPEKPKPALVSKPANALQPPARSKPTTEAKPAEEIKPPELKPDQSARPVEEGRVDEAKVVEKEPNDVWLTEYYAGEHRPKWADGLIAPLEKMLRSSSADQRLAAAVALVPLGKCQAVLPVIYEVARSDPKKYREALEVLPWLVWEQRLAAFRQLCKIAPSPDFVAALIDAMVEVHDLRAVEILWGLLADPKTTETEIGAIQRGLLSVHGIPYWYSPRSGNQSQANKSSLLELAKFAAPRAAGGSEKQRLVALSLLAYANPEEAFGAAEKMQADTAASAGLRNDAFQILLASAPPKEGARAAAAALAGKDRARQKLALHYFASGTSSMTTVRDTITVPAASDESSRRSGVPIVPKPPEGLQVSQLLGLLDDSDPASAAKAGYLLAVMGESRGLEPLLRYAQQQGKGDSPVQRLAYRGSPLWTIPARSPY